jgi:hypothetical protein
MLCRRLDAPERGREDGERVRHRSGEDEEIDGRAAVGVRQEQLVEPVVPL